MKTAASRASLKVRRDKARASIDTHARAARRHIQACGPLARDAGLSTAQMLTRIMRITMAPT